MPTLCASAVVGHSNRRLIADQDILAAARWRLEGWTAQEVEAATENAARLVANPGAYAPQQFQRPGDRRDPWTAACALMALHAQTTGDRDLFLRAGVEIIQAWRNSMARKPGAVRSTLAAMMAIFQANQPHAQAGEYFDLLASLAGIDPAIADFDQAEQVLTYADRDRLVDVHRDSFARQFRRVKKMLAQARTQRDGVRCA